MSQLTFLGGGGGGLLAELLFSELLLGERASWIVFFESTSDRTTKKWWHFSHFTNRVEAEREKKIFLKTNACRNRDNDFESLKVRVNET